MARKIRFPLKMKNGAEVRTLDELKENFDLESVLGYFADGKLSTWLADRYYDEKASAILAMSSDMPDLNAKMCEILEVEYQADEDDTDLELINRRKEKYRILSAFTDNKEILNNIDYVAMDQNDLFDILDTEPEKVYLYGEKFSIPFGVKNVCYIGVNNPAVLIDKSKYLYEYEEVGVTFENVCCGEAVNAYVTKGKTFYNKIIYAKALRWFERAAEYNNAEAQYYLGEMYFYGHGVEEDDSIALEWYRKAAEQGHIDAQYELGEMYSCGYGVEEDDSIALEWYRKAAEHGHIGAQYKLGEIYRNGDGVEDDDYEAIKWYRKAAEQGHIDAQFYLGSGYMTGYGIEMDISKAVEWFTRAAEKGHINAQRFLGDIYSVKDYSKAAKWYRKAAEQGDAYAQFRLGAMYISGEGVEKDYYEAVKWYRKAAEQDFTDAQNVLGLLYENGAGVEEDYYKAVDWYKKAAAKGNNNAKDNLRRLEISI